MIPQRTSVTLRPRDDGTVTLRSSAAGMAPRTVRLDGLRPAHDWSDYALGVVWALERRGLRCPGFECAVSSDVPVGAGLSSSAALELAVLRAMREAFGFALSDRDLAAVAHEAETGFVGAQVGQMDQLVCSLGRDGEALLIDFADLGTTAVRLPDDAFEIAVIDSGLRHDHATGGYNTRRAECDAAARALGVASLRDARAADLPRLPPVPARRARHVITENTRTQEAVAAIAARDVSSLGRLMNASHASLRDDFEVSLPAIDELVARAQAHTDVYGARLTGGGFGGSIVVLARTGRGRAAALAAIGRSGSGASVVTPAH